VRGGRGDVASLGAPLKFRCYVGHTHCWRFTTGISVATCCGLPYAVGVMYALKTTRSVLGARGAGPSARALPIKRRSVVRRVALSSVEGVSIDEEGEASTWKGIKPRPRGHPQGPLSRSQMGFASRIPRSYAAEGAASAAAA
jgi:hypothetical protein